jgi:hypothetical protein
MSSTLEEMQKLVHLNKLSPVNLIPGHVPGGVGGKKKIIMELKKKKKEKERKESTEKSEGYINNFLEMNPLKEKEKFSGTVTEKGFQPDKETMQRIKRNPELKEKLPNVTPTGDGGFTCDAGYFENVTITRAPTLTEQSRRNPIGMATTGKVVQKNDWDFMEIDNAKNHNLMEYRRVIIHESGVLFVPHLLKNHLPGSYPTPVICGKFCILVLVHQLYWLHCVCVCFDALY